MYMVRQKLRAIRVNRILLNFMQFIFGEMSQFISLVFRTIPSSPRILFVFHEISKYVDVQQSVKHPFTFQRTGNEYCLTALHHLSVKEYANIITIFSGIPGTEYNDRSHAVPAPLGCLLKVSGAGTGVAHVENENMSLASSSTLDGVDY